MAELWSREEFIFCLRAVGEQKYHHKHPFHIRMHQGQLSPEELRGWILNRFYYQKNIPVKDALVLSKLRARILILIFRTLNPKNVPGYRW